MAYDRQHLKWSFLYTVAGTDEIAVTSISTAGPSGWTGAAAALADIDQGNIDDIAEAYLTMFGVTGFSWANYSTFGAMKVAAVGTNGLYLTDARSFDLTTPTTGDDGNVIPQSTVVLSMRSPSTIGDANYGRMYIPHTMLVPTGTTPFGSPTAAATLSDTAADMVAQVNAIAEGLASPSTAVIMSSKGSGAAKAITRVGVDTVNDTQRRRRNQLVGEYVFNPVP